MKDIDKIHELSIEIVRQKNIYKKALNLIYMYGELVDAKFIAREAIDYIDNNGSKPEWIDNYGRYEIKVIDEEET